MYILFDIGGTKMRFAWSDNLGSFETPIIKENPGNYHDAMIIIKETFEDMREGRMVKAMIGGIAGSIDKENGSLKIAPNLKDWVGKPIQPDLRRLTGASVYLQNDADLSALGEAVYGAGNGYSVVAYMTISTGIGGGLVIDQQIVKNKFGFEPGHQIIDYKERKTLEDLIGGNSLEEQYSKKPKELPKDLYKNEITQILSIGVYNLIRFWSPEVVVLGGSQMNDIKVEDISNELRKYLKEIPDIKLAKLGDTHGLYGAMMFLNSNR